jgi:hypothetical protein
MQNIDSPRAEYSGKQHNTYNSRYYGSKGRDQNYMQSIEVFMAHIYPFGSTNFATPTEQSVYNALSKLSSKYYVFYDNRWTWQGRDIQTDFIVAKEGACIQVIEVKGGVWSRKHGQLFVNGSLPSSDPVDQVIKQKKALIDKLKQSGSFEGFLPISHAIAFPDTPGEAFKDCVDLPPILDSRSIIYIQDWVSAQMEHSAKEFRQVVCDIKMIDHLKKTLANDWSPSLQDYLNTQDAQLRKQTQQIFIAYDKLFDEKRVGVKGCAGSGKTWLMIRLANKLAQNGSISNILVTCKNIALGEWLKNQLKSNKNKIDVFPFLEQMQLEVKEASLHTCDVDGMEDSERIEFFRTILPELYYSNIAQSRAIKYDAILVDEAQTFREDEWVCIESLLKDPINGKLHTFFDDYQRIYGEVDRTAILEDQKYFSLAVNLRNTRSIHNHSLKYVDEDIEINQSNVTGAPVYYKTYNDNPPEKTAIKSLELLLDDLIQNNTISLKNITILTTRRKEDCFLREFIDQDRHIGQFQITSEIDSEDKITCTSAQKFRGLESQIVILGDLEGRSYKQLNYIAASRAKLMLFLLTSESFIEKHPELTEGCEEYTGNLDLKAMF